MTDQQDAKAGSNVELTGAEKPEWVAEVYRDWTTLQVLELGIAFAFNRETGRVYKLPSDECPFIISPWPVTKEIGNDR